MHYEIKGNFKTTFDAVKMNEDDILLGDKLA